MPTVPGTPQAPQDTAIKPTLSDMMMAAAIVDKRQRTAGDIIDLSKKLGEDQEHNFMEQQAEKYYTGKAKKTPGEHKVIPIEPTKE